LGIDIDANIVQVALKRLQRRHPKPDLEFVVADLLRDFNHPVWEHVKQATIITMYFATEGLLKFRPVLEAKLAGHKCKIITCGYDMPGWISKKFEVVNAMPLHLYEWGTIYDDGEEDILTFRGGDSINPNLEKEELDFERRTFPNMKIVDRTQNPYYWVNPKYKEEEEEWDYDWDAELESVGYKARGDSEFGRANVVKSKLSGTVDNDETVSIDNNYGKKSVTRENRGSENEIIESNTDGTMSLEERGKKKVIISVSEKRPTDKIP
jgi:hypothetical protein